MPGSRSKFGNGTTVPSLYSWNIAECDVKPQQPTKPTKPFLCPNHKMARGHLVFALSVVPSHQSLSSQLLLHPCMGLNETWYRCCTTRLEVHVGRKIMFGKFWQSYGPWHLEFLNILACLLNSFYILMKLGRDVASQVKKCIWGDNSCSTNFGRVMVLDNRNF